MNHKKRSKYPGLALGLVIVLLAGLGWWAGQGRGLQVAEEMRDALHRQADEMVRNINPELAKQVSFTPADRGAPAFEHLRDQMIAHGRHINQRGIYSMAVREGRIVFGPENYTLDGPMASPPGTVYQKPSAEVWEVFKTGKSAVVGPYKDEYGIFVSALAPVIDPVHNMVIMVVGQDVPAEDWEACINAARLGPIIASSLVILIILGSVVTLRRRNRSGRPGDLKLKPLIITPVAIAMLFVVAFWVAYQLQRSSDQSNRDMRRLLDSSSREWNLLVDSQVKMLRAQVDNLSHDRALMDIWRERDLKKLLASVQPKFLAMQREFNISHLYYVEPDRTCFLRVHSPNKRGDLIDRHTMVTAAQTGQDDWGIELGPMGTFTLRYVRPWKRDGQLLGYLEAGMDIQYLASNLAHALNLDLVAVVRKEYITRDIFETGRTLSGFTGQWDLYHDFVVVAQTVEDLPEDLSSRLEGREGAVNTGGVFTSRHHGRMLSCGFIRQADAAGRDVGEIILMQDVTTAHYSGRSLLVLSLGLAITLFGGILAILWSITGVAQGQLSGAFEEVREQQSRLEIIVNAISAPVFYKDRQGRYAGCNKAFEDFFGLTRAEIVGRFPWGIAPNDLAEIYHGMDMALMDGEEPGVYETEAVCADGTRRQVVFHKAPFRDGDGEICGIVGAMLDITERKRAEEALRESEHRIRGLLNATSDSVFLMNHSGMIIDLNRNAAERRDKKRADMLGNSVFGFLPFEAAEARRSAMACVVSTKSMFSYEEERDGKIYMLRLYPILNEVGEVVQLASFSRDNTDRKNLEDQLRQAMKMEAVGTLAGGVAHDFNNLLQAITGYTQLLMFEKNKDHPDYPKLASIDQAGGRAARLVRQLLLFSRKAKAERRTINLNRQVEQAGAILERTLPK